jgi:hypothetical protein
MPHVFENLSTKVLQKTYDNPLLWQLKNFNCHPKHNDDKMVTEIFQSPHLVPFQLPQGWVTKKIWTAFFCGNQRISINIQHTHNIKWQTKFFGHQRGKTGHDFFFPK